MPEYFHLKIPSFFATLESPAVPEYERQQEIALAKAVADAPKGRKRSKLLPLESVRFGPSDWDGFDSDESSEYSYKEKIKPMSKEKRVSILCGISIDMGTVEEENQSTEHVAKKDPRSTRGLLVSQKSVGGFEIDSSDGSLSDFSGGVPDGTRFRMESAPSESVTIMGSKCFSRIQSMDSTLFNSVNTIGSINIPGELLYEDEGEEDFRTESKTVQFHEPDVKRE